MTLRTPRPAAASQASPTHPALFMLLSLLLLGLAALLASPARAQVAPSRAAQTDGGEYHILEARYGTEQRNIDVTARLRELARADQQFRLTNELMGNDPDYGQVKTLRIYARHLQSGRIRTFEYSEGSVVDGAYFIGWRGGGWGEGRGMGRDGREGRDSRDGRGEGGWAGGWGRPGYADGGDGEYRIARALYGTPERHADVTDRLRELARADQRFHLGNNTFGGLDPDYGRVKTLRIFATGPRGQQKIFDYVEGSWVDGAQFSGWAGGGWGQQSSQPGQTSQPGQPGRPGRPGQPGQPGQPMGQPGAGWSGGGWGTAPAPGSGLGGLFPGLTGQRGLQIVSAVYGSGPQTVDVAAMLRERIQDGRTLNVTVNNTNAGVDPAPGVVKSLTVVYRIDGREQRRVVTEGQPLILP